MITQAVVHTTGINWESIGILLGALAAVAGVLITMQERRNKTIRDEIKESVTHLGEVLNERLETKDTVNKLAVRVARMEGARGIRSDDE